MPLGELAQSWYSDQPSLVKNNAIAAVSMSTLQGMQQDILDLYDLVALQRLKTEALATAPAATRGVFADPFLNDNMRDLGQEQTAAIIGGVLTLAVDAEPQLLDNSGRALTLPYEDELLIDQSARTGAMRINPYSAFDPVPATVQLTPAVDYWTKTETVSGGAITRHMGAGSATRTTTSVEQRTIANKAAEFLRPLTIKFRIEGFLPDEPLREVIFDGVKLPVEPI